MVWIFGGAYTRGRRIEPAQRRREPREEGRRPRHVQLPPRAVRLLHASRADEGVGTQRVGQPGAGRQHRGAAVGEDEHRGVRRRSEQRDDLRRVGRRGDGRRARRLAGGQGPVPPRDQRERRVDGTRHGPDDAARAGGARDSCPCPGRGGRGRGDARRAAGNSSRRLHRAAAARGTAGALHGRSRQDAARAPA